MMPWELERCTGPEFCGLLVAAKKYSPSIHNKKL